MTRMKWYAKTYIGVIMAFFYLPIFVLIAYSFNQSKSRAYFTGFTLDWYKQLFTNSVILSSLLNTLIIAVVSALVATVIGTAAAVGLDRMRGALKAVILNFTYMPIINPDIITGVSMMLLFTSIQAVALWLKSKTGVDLTFQYGYGTLILAHITFCIPYVILNVMPKLRQIDPNVYEAALDLGCSEWQAYTKVVIPDIMPGIVAGLLTSVTMSLDDFIISYFVSGPNSQTLPITIFAMTRRKVSPEVNALSTIIFVVILAVLVIVNINDAQRERAQRALRAREGRR